MVRLSHIAFLASGIDIPVSVCPYHNDERVSQTIVLSLLRLQYMCARARRMRDWNTGRQWWSRHAMQTPAAVTSSHCLDYAAAAACVMLTVTAPAIMGGTQNPENSVSSLIFR